MATEETKIIDGSSSEDMLMIDLGKSISEIYDTLEGVEISSDDPGILDPEFYRKKLGEVRGSLNIIQSSYAKVMRAKTSAQTRLTSRETRFEILLNSSLENNTEVKEALSADERKARAANRLVDLKNAIRESKNEVEALSNLLKVLGVYSKSLGTISADLKQQAKLVEVELQHMPKMGYNKQDGQPSSALSADDAAKLFQKRLDDVVDAYSMNPVDSSEDNGEDSVEEEEGIVEDSSLLSGMMQSFADTSSEINSSMDTALELPTEISEKTEDIEEDSNELRESSDESSGEDFTLPEESTPTDYVPSEMDFDIPSEEPPSVTPSSTVAPKVGLEVGEVDKIDEEDTPYGEDEESSVKEEELLIFDDDFTLPASEETLSVSEDVPNLTGLSLTGVSSDLPMDNLEVASPSQEPVVSEGDLSPENFEVLSTTETKAKISEEFSQTPKTSEDLEPAKVNTPKEAKSTPEESTQEPSIDDLLNVLLGTT
jgi:hypothetical protein